MGPPKWAFLVPLMVLGAILLALAFMVRKDVEDGEKEPTHPCLSMISVIAVGAFEALSFMALFAGC